MSRISTKVMIQDWSSMQIFRDGECWIITFQNDEMIVKYYSHNSLKTFLKGWLNSHLYVATMYPLIILILI